MAARRTRRSKVIFGLLVPLYLSFLPFLVCSVSSSFFFFFLSVGGRGRRRLRAWWRARSRAMAASSTAAAAPSSCSAAMLCCSPATPGAHAPFGKRERARARSAGGGAGARSGGMALQHTHSGPRGIWLAGASSTRRQGLLARLFCCVRQPADSSEVDGRPTARPAAPAHMPPAQADPGNNLLPALRKEDRGRKCLVLDLDETLVHSSFKVLCFFFFFFFLIVCLRGNETRELREMESSSQSCLILILIS